MLFPWTTIRSPGNPRADGEAELAEGGDVGAEPLGGEEPEQGDVGERLDAVGEESIRRSEAIRLRAGVKRLLAVDEERRAVLLGEGRRSHPSQRKLSGLDLGAVGQQLEH